MVQFLSIGTHRFFFTPMMHGLSFLLFVMVFLKVQYLELVSVLICCLMLCYFDTLIFLSTFMWTTQKFILAAAFFFIDNVGFIIIKTQQVITQWIFPPYLKINHDKTKIHFVSSSAVIARCTALEHHLNLGRSPITYSDLNVSRIFDLFRQFFLFQRLQ